MSPAFAAAWLLFGLVFAMAAAHFFSLPWGKPASVVVYSIPTLWCLLILRNRKGLSTKVNVIDLGFTAFILVVLISAFVFPGLDENGSVWKYLRFMPFLMITPYFLGRMMSVKDTELLAGAILLAGLALLPMLLLDYLTVTARPWRLPIFGLDHGPLMVGGLLAATLLVLCTRLLSLDKKEKNGGGLRGLVLLGLIGCVTVMLVWVMARGWLISALVAVAVMSSMMRGRPLVQRIGLSAYVFAIAILTLLMLPASSFYNAVLSVPIPAFATAGCPILGEASCQPFKDGVDSIAIRWVMYRESLELFIQNPVWGMGVARFGNCSCAGPGWYPHNTILQGFAELGLVGGGLQIGLFILAAVALMRRLIFNQQASIEATCAFVFGLFVLYLVSDQFYGNYLMAAGIWLMLGIAASLYPNSSEESSRA